MRQNLAILCSCGGGFHRFRKIVRAARLQNETAPGRLEISHWHFSKRSSLPNICTKKFARICRCGHSKKSRSLKAPRCIPLQKFVAIPGSDARFCLHSGADNPNVEKRRFKSVGCNMPLCGFQASLRELLQKYVFDNGLVGEIHSKLLRSENCVFIQSVLLNIGVIPMPLIITSWTCSSSEPQKLPVQH